MIARYLLCQLTQPSELNISFLDFLTLRYRAPLARRTHTAQRLKHLSSASLTRGYLEQVSHSPGSGRCSSA